MTSSLCKGRIRKQGKKFISWGTRNNNMLHFPSITSLHRSINCTRDAIRLWVIVCFAFSCPLLNSILRHLSLDSITTSWHCSQALLFFNLLDYWWGRRFHRATTFFSVRPPFLSQPRRLNIPCNVDRVKQASNCFPLSLEIIVLQMKTKNHSRDISSRDEPKVNRGNLFSWWMMTRFY